VFKALELIEFADLIPPLQAELQGAVITSARTALRCSSHPTHTVYRELVKNKKGSSAGGGSASATAAQKKSSTAAQRGKGKERTTEASESSVSAPLPNALGALSLEPQSKVRVHAPPEAPDADEETYAIPERDDGEGVGDGDDDDDDDQTEAEPEMGPDIDEAEEDEAEDVDEGAEVDMNMNLDADLPGDGDDMEGEDVE
jgi:DNA polymerase epsilon subunit 3